MKNWRKRGGKVLAGFEQQEAAVLRGLVSQLEDMLRARAEEAPQDPLVELTGIRTGPAESPNDPVLSRLLPDYHKLDPDKPSKEDLDSASALRSLHEPELVEAKVGMAAVVMETLPRDGGDVRHVLGDVESGAEDMPDELPEEDPRSPHLGVYHWLTWVQESLVQALAG